MGPAHGPLRGRAKKLIDHVRAALAEADMVKSGLAIPGALMGGVAPLTIGNAVALATWNRIGGEARYSDLLYALAREDVDDIELMLDRMDTIRREMKEAAAHGK